MFEKERFIEDCKAAMAEGREAQKAVRELVSEAVSDPAAVVRELGVPEPAVRDLHMRTSAHFRASGSARPRACG